ncbi:ABC transporter permease [Desemzia sp. RIT804]|uniref:ABC transporter permease n=1 Tax=Desemzia sp. RIT 804 TaxID=2810209 RepID=UPI00194E78E7|nr:ABC transporter permease [Desemzia sp. RIT 804]MBM6613326.1 ABC transporter permease [Desemzia sp. RIT 804]
MNKFWVIVGEVYRKNVKSLGFISMVFAPIVILLVIAAIIYFVSASENGGVPEIAVLSEDQQVQAILQAEEEQFEVNTEITTVEDAETAMEAEELDGYLVVEEENGVYQGNYVYSPDSQDVDTYYLTGVLSSVQQIQQAESLGLTQEDIASILTPATLEQTRIEFEGGGITTTESAEDALRMGSAYAVGIAVFMFIMTYSSIIGEEIASEKGTRIMEVILSSVSSTIHFFGKLVAIVLICFTQIAIYVVLGAIALQLDFVQDLLQGIDISAIFQGLLGTSLAYFILGIVLYAILAAFLGSLVSKVEDVSKAVTPIVFLSLAGFYAGMFAFYNPTHMIVKIGSYIPLFTSFIMPFRVASDTVTTTGVMISIVGLILFVLLTTWLSLLLYRSSVLIYSDAGMFKTMKTSFKAMRRQQKV